MIAMITFLTSFRNISHLELEILCAGYQYVCESPSEWLVNLFFLKEVVSITTGVHLLQVIVPNFVVLF